MSKALVLALLVASFLVPAAPSALAQDAPGLTVTLENSLGGDFLADIGGARVGLTATTTAGSRWLATQIDTGAYILQNEGSGRWLGALGPQGDYDVISFAQSSESNSWEAVATDDGTYSLRHTGTGGWLQADGPDISLTDDPAAVAAQWIAEVTSEPDPEPTGFFETLPPGADLPSGEECAAAVSADRLPEVVASNAAANARTGGPSIIVDGTEELPDDSLSQRVTGDFTGSTEDLIRWASCKWGFNEDVTRARVIVESGALMSTQGDFTSNELACESIGLTAPCYQSYGLLQLKASIHQGSYPASATSTAWGLDYAMAWQRACYDGVFTWLDDPAYEAGNIEGCVGAWFSGEWLDAAALGYNDEVIAVFEARPWDQ